MFIQMGNRLLTLLTGVLFFLASCAYASEDGAGHEIHGEKKFNAGSFIFGHIGNAYDWHVATYAGNHITLPLPVIVYSQTSGLHVFMSSKFHHGHESYEGFKIAHEGVYVGKIVEMVNGEEIAPLDLSITKIVAAMLFSMALILVIFISIAKAYRKREGHAPSGLQSWMEPLILFVRDDIAKPCIGEGRYKRFMPFLLTVFFFIFINNLLGLIPILPGGANVTGSMSVALVLALFTFLITTFSSNKGYWGHIFNTPGVPWWLKFPVPLMPVVELMGVLTKPFVLMVRLSANITAGHIIGLGFVSLIFIFGEMHEAAGLGASVLSVAFSIFMSLLELLVAFIQAYVFTMLSALYFGMAKVDEHH